MEHLQDWRVDMTKVKCKRHAAKAVSYRILGTLITIIMAWILTDRFSIALSFGVVEVCVKTLAYFLHERFWYKFIKYGVTQDGKSNSK